MLIIKKSGKFKTDYKKINKNKNLKKELRKILEKLQYWEKLDIKYKDHKLKWDYFYARECHIRPDLLLIYEIREKNLVLLLLRLWSHSELF